HRARLPPGRPRSGHRLPPRVDGAGAVSAAATKVEDPHLLVVDDDERLRELLQRYLSSNGFRVSAAGDAAEARALMKSIAFDLFILDVMMPGETGLELTRAIRANL